jgi:hypothetical protein
MSIGAVRLLKFSTRILTFMTFDGTIKKKNMIRSFYG